MKCFHDPVAVNDLAASIRFYSPLFAEQPNVLKNDYAIWMLDDPQGCCVPEIPMKPQAGGKSHVR